MKKKVLFVHAYAVNIIDGSEVLDPFMESVISKVASCHENYDLVISLGGWHDHLLGEHRLLGDIMIEKLIEAGVPEQKLKWIRSFDFVFKYLPPRSTEEEIILAQMISNINEDNSLTDTEYSVCIVDLFAVKALKYYEMLGIKIAGLELAVSDCNPAKSLAVTNAVLNRLLSLVSDPGLKNSEIVKHLESRTLGKGYFRPDPKIYL